MWVCSHDTQQEKRSQQPAKHRRGCCAAVAAAAAAAMAWLSACQFDAACNRRHKNAPAVRSACPGGWQPCLGAPTGRSTHPRLIRDCLVQWRCRCSRLKPPSGPGRPSRNVAHRRHPMQPEPLLIAFRAFTRDPAAAIRRSKPPCRTAVLHSPHSSEAAACGVLTCLWCAAG